ncbi:hypothetical protein [Streptomyces sp. NPDC017529]|uniref:hypothetical protein n=1 Tax=Streptomyces sp. NPDC017529 TaxID=3365000 RepID=UPI0037AFEF8F
MASARDRLNAFIQHPTDEHADAFDELVIEVEKDAASAALRDVADWAETANPDRSADFSEGVDWLLAEIRRIADEAKSTP